AVTEGLLEKRDDAGGHAAYAVPSTVREYVRSKTINGYLRRRRDHHRRAAACELAAENPAAAVRQLARVDEPQAVRLLCDTWGSMLIRDGLAGLLELI